MWPKPGRKMRWTSNDGRKVLEGRVKNIARMRTGSVCAFFEGGASAPVTKHGVWEDLEVEFLCTGL